MDESKIDIINPFGPAIAKVKMSENYVWKVDTFLNILRKLKNCIRDMVHMVVQP